MPYSSIDRMIWDDPWFRSLPARTKLLWLYAWSNSRVNPACCYRIVLDDMARATGFEDEADPEFTAALEALAGHMTYFPAGYLWVHGFVHHQTGSPHYLQGVKKCLERELPPEIAKRVVDHNRQRGILIPYAYGMHTVAETPDTVLAAADTVSSTSPHLKNTSSHEGGETSAPPPATPALSLNNSRPTWPEEARVLQSIAGYPFDPAKDGPLMDTLAEAYAQLDLAQELLRMKTWLVAKGYVPLKGQAGPRSRVRRWMQKADEIWRDRAPSTRDEEAFYDGGA